MIETDVRTPPDWQDHGLCTYQDPTWWDGIPTNPSPYAPLDFSKARAVCQACPVRQICLGVAMDTEDTGCMRGGKDPKQLKELLKEHRRRRSARRTRSLMVVHPRNAENRPEL